MDKKKYTLSQPTKEEREAFLKELGELTTKHSFYIEAVPVYKRKDLNIEMGKPPVFETSADLLIQKATEVVEAEVVSPIQHDDLAKD